MTPTGREQLLFDFRTHESGTCESAPHEEEPNRAPPKGVLKRANGEKADGRRDRSASVDETCDSPQGLLASPDRRVRRKIGSDGGCDNVVGSANESECKLPFELHRLLMFSVQLTLQPNISQVKHSIPAEV